MWSIEGENVLKTGQSLKWRPRFAIFLFCLIAAARGQIRYSIPEEMKPGVFIGDVTKDLGLDVKRLVSGWARLVIDDSKQYVELNRNKGHLVVKERIDREKLCGQKSPCSFGLEILLENPLEFFSVTVEIEDINDHAPAFSKKEIHLETSESAPIGTVFLLDTAADPDVGLNSLQSYSLKPTDNFALREHSRSDGSKYAEMVLQTPLDREKHSEYSLILTAVDGGNPPRSGTVTVHISVLDVNDNVPAFTESLYKASVLEDAAVGTLITKISATDEDQGHNGNVTYSFTNVDDAQQVFHVNAKTGEIKLADHLDFEVIQHYEINLQAKDSGGLAGTAKLVIDVLDVNDNAPVITMTSFSGKIQEDSPPSTAVALISVQDVDSGKNGKVQLYIDRNVPFAIKSSSRKYYTLITDAALDREKFPSFNLTITASDEGTPSLSTTKNVFLEITDVNDNAPSFSKSEYRSRIIENNSPGVSVFTLQATDADKGQNARVAYYLVESDVSGSPASTYFSINSDNGVLHAVRSFDYEQIKEFKIQVRAQDGGSPPLSSNATVFINIQDQNDNAPQVLYPVQTGGSLVAEIVPRSADVGYLVTKVVAVDVDSGQNAWLSYKLQKATDRALFEVGLQNGEIRTVRQVTDKDAVKQKLTVVVEDNGQPSRSATVNINVAVADSFPEVLSEFTDFTHDKEYDDSLTFYLVLALAVVSFLFVTCLVVIISVKIYRWRQYRTYYQSKLPVIPYYPPRYADSVGTGTLQHAYNYEAYRTTDSRKSDVRYVGPDTLPKEARCIDGTDTSSTLQKPPNPDWRFTQNQRPGPSGAAATPEVAMGTGPWPNPPTEAEQLQALMAAANEVSEATNTLGPGTMGLSARYGPQFTLQHVPDYRQNVYIPGSTATLTAGGQPTQPLPPQQVLPPPQACDAQAEPPKASQTPACKKKSAKKEKK
ncbi:protocadherin gamma-A11-like isoform X17 [Electrophorus electricus]|uniref:protocadherin gamma-A11-like isoform X17 n=1 Tax=Electrophorus electricus TaxID=8005 RepID=UPI0015D083EB|nr:protocadherin gamma-A11-like isoform X17 [Electrophorus electricus]